tara:strand:- start:670 stop:807 length:138 start_codon:yes stop_codon:yes gene_type:complete
MGVSAKASDAGIEWCLGMGPDSNSVVKAASGSRKAPLAGLLRFGS